jgi:hypothetical protein
MLYRSALWLLPVMAVAQTPPPEVDQALRERVTAFFQYSVDGDFRKAYDLVAEDTKDYYFNTQKNKIKSFKIDTITFGDDFTTAEVQLTCERVWRMSSQFPESVIPVPMKTSWKLDGGKWAYHYDPSTAPRLIPLAPGTQVSASGTNEKAPSLTEAAVAAKAREILQQQSNVDKSAVTLATDKASSDQVVFHNGFPGWVKVGVDPGLKVSGFTVELDKTAVSSGENATLKLRYEPSGEGSPQTVTVRLIVEPFNQSFPILVNFAAASEKSSNQ